MSTLPDFTGPGFFAGEAPDGLTTIAGTPTSASVRVYWRDPADPQAPDVLVDSTQSAADGTWQIAGLNPALRYVVRAQKSNFYDATVVGAQPSRTDVIAYVDSLGPTEDFDGLTGYVLLDSGLPPFTCQVIEPLPYGLSARIEGRKLLIEGKSEDAGRWESMVRVTASNGVWVDVPVQVYIPWTPSDLEVPPKIWLDDESMEVDGSKVVRWRSRSGGALDFTAVANKRPDAVVNSIFGRSVVSFDGIDDALSCDTPAARSIFKNVGAGWCFACYKKRAVEVSAVDRTLIRSDTPGGPARFALNASSSLAGANRVEIGVRRLDSDSFKWLGSTESSAGRWILVFAQQDWSTGIGRIYIDGDLNAESVSLTSAGVTSNTEPVGAGIVIGAGGNYRYVDADVACVLVGSGAAALSISERLRIEGWAAHRYGLADLLPADHPYKEAAP